MAEILGIFLCTNTADPYIRGVNNLHSVLFSDTVIDSTLDLTNGQAVDGIPA